MISASDRILKAAISCFAERGFAGASTRELAAAAKCNVATLAYYFGDKEGVYKAAIGRLYEQLLAIAPVIQLEDTDVETLVRTIIAFMREHRDEVRLLMRHVLDHRLLPTPVREEYAGKLLEHGERVRVALGLAKDPAWKQKLLTISYVFARYAISEDEDLRAFFTKGTPTVDDHLVWVTKQMLATELPSTGSRRTSRTRRRS